MRMGTFRTIAITATVGMMLSMAPASAWALPADSAVDYDGSPTIRVTNDASVTDVTDEAAGAAGSAAESIPDNPTQALPDKVDESIPDNATLVSPDLAVTKSGEVKDVTTGEKVTDPELVGTKRQQPDPLAKTDGESFIPVSVGETKDQIEGKSGDAQASAETGASTAKNAAYTQAAQTDQSARSTVRTAALENNEYGAYWGTYSGRPAFFEADGTLFAQDAKGVVDVSEWQGEIDWQAAKNAGVQGAIIRIGYGWGNGFDATALRNISECQRLGIPFGIYLYSYAYDNATARAEGQNVVNLLHEAGISPGDLGYPVYYDLERWTWTGYAPPTDPDVYDGIVNTWYAQLQDAGFTNLSVYSYTSYLYGPLDSANIHGKTRWVAQYGPAMGYGEWATNDRMWQYTSGGSVPGIAGRVDLNAFGYEHGLVQRGPENSVYRVYNRRSGLHHYTTNYNEALLLADMGWNYEGITFQAASSGQKVYRLYNHNDGNHMYTTSVAERNMLKEEGWKDEGLAWYVPSDGTVNVYRLYNPNSGEHVYTTGYGEYLITVAAGWTGEGIAWKGK